MFEHHLRWVLAGVMFVTLFLPNSGNSNWLYAFWYPLEILSNIFYSTSNLILGSGLLLFLLSIPILILLNVSLAISSSQRLKKFYRIALLVLFSLTWWGTLSGLSNGAWGIGFWANPLVITAAVLMESALVGWNHIKRSENWLATIALEIEHFLLRRWVAPVLSLLLILFLLVCYVALGYASDPHFGLASNQRRWESTKPSVYYIVVAVSQPGSGTWRCEVCVRDGRPEFVRPLHNSSAQGSWLDPDSPTIEQIFVVLDRYCIKRGPNCEVEFDPQFYYPKRVDSHERFLIEVEQFVPYEGTIEDCP